MEWVLLELQGGIEGRDGSALNGLPLGTLDVSGKSASLLVGNQRLHGTTVELPKPLAVLRKAEEAGPTPAYGVVGFVRRKLVFKSRPQPVVPHSSLAPISAKRKR